MIVTLQRRPIITWLVFVLVAVAYLAQIATPLRLVGDGIDYLLQASSAVDGDGFRVHGERSMRPPGYPTLIVVLTKAGVGRTWAIVALNCLLLGIGCWASYFLLRISFGFQVEAAQLICLLTLLSFVMVKHVTYPLSDICFFGASTTCLLMFLQAEGDTQSRRFWRLIFAALLMAFCIELRTIGVALIPAFVWALVGGATGARKATQRLRQHRIASILLLLFTLILVAGIVESFLHSRYLQFNLPIFQKRGVLGTLASNLLDHTTEWGELTVNAPVSKLPGVLELPVRIVGLFAIMLCAIGIWQKCKKVDALVWYGLGYACIVLAYPWCDARLWLPVLPLLIAYVLIGMRRIVPPKLVRPVVLAYCALFCLLGVVALAYTTRLTFAGARFPDLYGDGLLRATYRTAFQGEMPNNANDINQDALYLLRRYERRSAPK
jgi:ABC-type multidrug transport system fused ATPase/permease subunit